MRKEEKKNNRCRLPSQLLKGFAGKVIIGSDGAGSALESQRRNIKSPIYLPTRVAELGSLSSGAKMAMKIFVKPVFIFFASNALFLRIVANLQN